MTKRECKQIGCSQIGCDGRYCYNPDGTKRQPKPLSKEQLEELEKLRTPTPRELAQKYNEQIAKAEERFNRNIRHSYLLEKMIKRGILMAAAGMALGGCAVIVATWFGYKLIY